MPASPPTLSKPRSRSFKSSWSPGDDEELSAALERALTPGLTRTVNLDDHAVPQWFSLVKSGLSYNDAMDVYSPPCLGVMVEPSMMMQTEGASALGANSEVMFCAAQVASMSQSLSALSALYLIKLDDEAKISAYAAYLTSPLISVTFGSLLPNDTVSPGEDVETVSCEGVMMIKVEELINALHHYSSSSKTVAAMRDVFAARYADHKTLAIGCLMRVPTAFWKGDFSLHTKGRVCICTRTPAAYASPSHWVTSGYRAVMMDKWFTNC
jgi:hypothetical protein